MRRGRRKKLIKMEEGKEENRNEKIDTKEEQKEEGSKDMEKIKRNEERIKLWRGWERNKKEERKREGERRKWKGDDNGRNKNS